MGSVAQLLSSTTLHRIEGLPARERRAAWVDLFDAVQRRHDAVMVAAMTAAEFASTADPDDGRRMFAALDAAGLKPTI